MSFGGWALHGPAVELKRSPGPRFLNLAVAGRTCGTKGGRGKEGKKGRKRREREAAHPRSFQKSALMIVVQLCRMLSLGLFPTEIRFS